MSYPPPLSRCIYTLGDGLLFDEIVTHWLTVNTRLRVISRIYAGEAGFLADVILHQPDVILLMESKLFDFEQIVAWLSRISLKTDLRVILVGMNDNIINLYDFTDFEANRRATIPHVRLEIANWNEFLDLVSDRQLPA
jgi:hypothetical protein